MLMQVATRDTRGQADYAPALSARTEGDTGSVDSPWLDLSPWKASFLCAKWVGFVFMLAGRAFPAIREAANETVPTEEPEPQLSTSIVMECSALSGATEDILEAVPLEEDILRAMTEADVSIPLPSKRRYAVDLRVRAVRKALPRVIEPG
jgi:hypothetical protein